MMELKDILSAQQTWLDQLKATLPEPGAAVRAALGSVQAQANAIQARIEELTKRKAALVSQLDAAIAQQQNALAALRAGPVARSADLLRS
jgi:hypothetical protein